MAYNPTKEGSIPFPIRSVNKTCFTYYKIFGDLSCGQTPVICLHGGSGAGHEYLYPFAQLWYRFNVPIVLYDQIGCGLSTHLPEKVGDKSFWQPTLFLAELNNLLDHLELREGRGFHLLGQSWGAALGAIFAADQPQGLQRLVLASGSASKDLSIEGIKLRIGAQPADVKSAFAEAERSGDFTSDAYRRAVAIFSKDSVCRADSMPSEMLMAMKTLNEDKTVYSTMNGPSMTYHEGAIRWSTVAGLPRVRAPTLIYNGEFDTSADVGQQPFFQLIPRVRWIIFAGAGHMIHLESKTLQDRVLEVVGTFLTCETPAEGETVV
ncbi:proline-specific peptidase [Myriangium duriaei CBS 260.36]|uniref:Proline-specific peptidase n=1 Tax=Myriangium duriaei CBS 260.36 TaxID=1168546 RepID=A0A9P4MGH8_9PEZI|nr:proline-specific peptidase [Myriangium duriaei CBS 260.36]